jgi:hypothetical protein
MKTILKGNDAIEMYAELQGSYPAGKQPKISGYFVSDDCDWAFGEYDKGTIIAFESTGDGMVYEDAFGTVNDAIEWIES